jgi:uncharacterized membrane protein
MHALIIKYLYRLRASYWFVPAVMVVGAIAFSILTLWMDRRFGDAWLEHVPFLDANTPESARSVLSAIAGSMITVAGVTFSMTILSVSFAAAQFGPRLIGNFMRDRGNQVTLGTFIAAYVYCLMVIRSVRGAEELATSAASGDALQAFVPQISVLCGIALALSSVSVLIYFIHHVPETIDVSNIAKSVGRELESSIQTLFPESIGTPPAAQDGDDGERPALCEEEPHTVAASAFGYLQAVDGDGLFELATERDLIVRLQYRPGDFATGSDLLLHVWPKDAVDDELESQLRACFAWGGERTPTQNTLFLVDQLVEIVARALSPGVNDPFTAIACLQWLERSLITLGERRTPGPFRYDDDGALRVISHAVPYSTFCERVFGQTRQYVAADRNASLATMQMLASLVLAQSDEDRRTVLLGHVDTLAEASQSLLPLESDRELVRGRAERIHQMARDPDVVYEVREDEGWFGGSA